MTTEDKLTPWFDYSVKPVREGVYQTWGNGYAYFDGNEWGLTDKSPDEAVIAYSMFSAGRSGVVWRGLAECQQPDLFASL